VCTATKTFGQIFLQYAPFIKGYSRYFNEFENINITLEDIRKNNKPLQTWLDNQRRTEGAKNKPLAGILITPIQRVPRYRILLVELVKYTSPYHKDYSLLQNALKEISEVAAELNGKMLENQHRARLYAISDNLKGRERLTDMEPGKNIVQPSRIFCEEVNLVGVYSKKFNTNITNAVLIVFNNMFIFAKSLEPGKPTACDEEGRITYSYDHLEFVLEPVLCDSKLVEKQSDLYPFPWIVDIPTEEENKVEETTPTTITPPVVKTGSNSGSVGSSSGELEKPKKHLINDIYVFKKPLFQLVGQKDVYTLQFNTVEEKLNCLKLLHDKIDDQYKDCKLKEKEQKRCLFQSYEQERIKLCSENKRIIPQDEDPEKTENTINQLFASWTYMTAKDLPKISGKKKQEEMNKIVNETTLGEFRSKFNVKAIEASALGAYYATSDFIEADASQFQMNFHVGDIFILWQKVKKGKKWLIMVS